MALRELVDDLRERQPGERLFRTGEYAAILSGSYFLTKRILGVRLVPSENFRGGNWHTKSHTPVHFQVVRESITGSERTSTSAKSFLPSEQVQQFVENLNDEEILLRANNTEKVARQTVIGLGIVAAAATYCAIKVTRAYKSHRKA